MVYRARRPEVPGWGPFFEDSFERISVREFLTIRE
jgi:hypothetical protein